MTAFEVTGGVPFRQIRYDNLSPAVAKVLAGRNRTETARWLSFRAHYGFEAFYCQPGTEGAHEKGGIEGEIGRFRRRWFVPVPQVGVAGRAERPAGRGRRRRGRPAHRGPGGHDRGGLRRRAGPAAAAAARAVRHRRGAVAAGGPVWRGSAWANAGIRCRPG